MTDEPEPRRSDDIAASAGVPPGLDPRDERIAQLAAETAEWKRIALNLLRTSDRAIQVSELQHMARMGQALAEGDQEVLRATSVTPTETLSLSTGQTVYRTMLTVRAGVNVAVYLVSNGAGGFNIAVANV